MNADETSPETTAPPPAAFTPLHPDQIWVLRIRAAITAAFLVLMAWIADLGPLRATPLAPGLAPGLMVVLALIGIFIVPRRRYRAWGYREEEDELHIRFGLLTRVRAVVPFGRVQHIDIAQGPIERRFELATLILHTAGTRGAAVPLPGLEHDEAERMRDRIRAKIREELV